MNCIKNEHIKIIMYKKWTKKNKIIINECIKNERIKNELIKKELIHRKDNPEICLFSLSYTWNPVKNTHFKNV